MTAPRLALLSCAASRASDLRLAKLVKMMGVEAVTLDLCGDDAGEDLLGSAKMRGCSAIAASSDALARLKDQARIPRGSPDSLLAGFDHAFIYGFRPDEGDDLAAWLTGRALLRCAHIHGGCGAYAISPAAREIAGPLAGLKFPPTAGGRGFAAGQANLRGGAVRPIITLGQRPCLALAKFRGCRVFLCAEGEPADLDEKVDAGGLDARHYAGLLPPLLFLRSAFGEYCWNNPIPHATLTIDDPLLRPRYGFLRFDRLVAEMEAHRFATTLAFIPWNYRRTDARVAELLRAHGERFSLCIHGCDHTAAEFADDDEAMLRDKARTAISRMRAHAVSSGLRCEPIMIFPQGGFSGAALRALAAEGYLAAVNSSVLASGAVSRQLTVRDLLDVAVAGDGGLPLFGRRYPIAPFPFAFDLFMGKPALIVEHHDYFKNGYTAAREFVRSINEMEPRISWTPLEASLTEAALYRKTGPAAAEVKFYTRRFRVRNPYGSRTAFRISRPAADGDSPTGLLLNGSPLEHRSAHGRLEAEVELGPGEQAAIEVSGTDARARPDARHRLAHEVRVALRRRLSEFRDNHLAGNERLVALSRKFARRIHV